ncbi:hypothetical protein ACWDSJ_32180 [Nocardia sp. NPDC003482]
MAGERTWEDLVPELCDVAVKHGGTTYLSDGQVIVSAKEFVPTDHSARSIVITRFDDETVRIRTGWCIDSLADLTIAEPGRLSFVASLIDAICLGGAEEHAFLDSDGRWTGVAWRIRTPRGAGVTHGDFDGPHGRAVHRLEAWGAPSS